MKLTGKCKELFNKWISDSFELNENPIVMTTSYEGDLETYASDHFDTLSPSMQYGVYVDFFDSVGMLTHCEVRVFDKSHITWLHTNSELIRVGRFNTRLEARTKAIEKANDLYNKRV